MTNNRICQFLCPTHFTREKNGTFTEVARGTFGAVNQVDYDETIPDMVFPIFGTLQFIVYYSWLRVAQSLLNPIGDDENSFDVCYLIDRNIQVSYVHVNGVDNQIMDDLEDPFEGAIPTSLPETPTENIGELPSERNMAYMENPEDGDLEVIHAGFDQLIHQIRYKIFSMLLCDDII